MKHTTRLTIITAITLFWAPALGAQERDGNAALRYWRAISLASGELETAARASAPPAEGAEWIISAYAREASSAIRDIADIAAKGAALSTCDFGVDYEEGTSTLVPHLGAMRSLAFLLLIDARLLEEAGDHDGAIERLVTAHRLAAHLRTDNFLIGSITVMSVYVSIDRTVGWFDAEGLLNAADRAALLTALELFQGDDPFGARRAIGGERRITIEWIRDRLGDEDLLKQIRHAYTFDGEEDIEPTLAPITQALAEGRPIEPYLILAEQCYAHIIEHWNDPDAVEKLEEIKSRVGAGVYGPFGELLAPAMGNVKRNELAAIELVRARAASLGG